jgi:hypothetical protein
MKKLAIYFGYPSCINESRASLDDAVRAFAEFDVLVLGAGLEAEQHADYENSLHIISRLRHAAVEVHGYLDLGITTQNCPRSDAELCSSLENWKKTSVDGILVDDIEPEYGTPTERIKKTTSYAHCLKLGVIYNTDLAHLDRGFGNNFEPVNGDAVLIEPFAFGHGKHYDISQQSVSTLRDFKERGFKIYGVSTYNPRFSTDQAQLLTTFSRCRALAERAQLDAFGFTDMSYSTNGAQNARLVNFFGS